MGRSAAHGRACALTAPRLSPAQAEAFIRANTDAVRPPHVPEIALHLATEAHALWLKTEAELEATGLEPPYWAFAWAGGQGLARFLLDHPDQVRGRRVVDFASGSGLAAIAAAMAGASVVTALDVDPLAGVAIRLNAALNGVSIAVEIRDAVGEALDADLLIAGDIFYDRALAARALAWFEALGGAGVAILAGCPGRSYFSADRFETLAVHSVPVTRALEDAEAKRTTVWRWTGARRS